MSAALVIVGLAAFLAGVVNAAFSTGGVFVMVAVRFVFCGIFFWQQFWRGNNFGNAVAGVVVTFL